MIEYDELEMWGLGVLGLSRSEFMRCSFSEFNSRIKGFMIRAGEIEQIGARRVFAVIYNGFGSFGKSFKAKSEDKLWPMSIDKMNKRKASKFSHEIVEANKDMLKKIWG